MKTYRCFDSMKFMIHSDTTHIYILFINVLEIMTQIYPIFLNARTHAHKNIATLIRGKLTFLGIVVMTNKLLLSHVQIHMT